MKCIFEAEGMCDAWSPPSRGAWIEIKIPLDRVKTNFGRPPRGGRGLKYIDGVGGLCRLPVAPLAGGVD